MMLAADLCGIKLKNPTILASGILGISGKLIVRVASCGAGAVTFKSVSLKPRDGHKNPCVLAIKDAVINAVGLSNPGVDNIIDEIVYAKSHTDVPVIASIFGQTKEEYGRVARRISKAKPDMIEVNISCPNVESEFGKPFCFSVFDSAEITRIVKRNTSVPVIVKLSPNVPEIGKVAAAVAARGADAICAVNTLGPKQFLERTTKRPLLSNGSGGISGPRIFRRALAAVREIRNAVSIPIIGTGGITTGEDAFEMLDAGASAVGIGSAVHFRGIEVFKKISDELGQILKTKRIRAVGDLHLR